MTIIINSFISQITKILVFTLILSIGSIFFIYSSLDYRDSKLEEYNEKKLIKIEIKPKLSKSPLIFEEALNVIFLTRFLNTTEVDLSKTLPPLTFVEYNFESNLFLNFDKEDFFKTLNEKVRNNIGDFFIEDHLVNENSVHMFLSIACSVHRA